MFARIAHLTLLATSLLGPCILSATYSATMLAHSATMLAQDVSTPPAQAAALGPASSNAAHPAPPSQGVPTAQAPAPGTSALPTTPPPVVASPPAGEQAAPGLTNSPPTGLDLSAQPPTGQGQSQATGTGGGPNAPATANSGGTAAGNTAEPAGATNAAASSGPANAPAGQASDSATPSTPSTNAAASAPTPANPSSPATPPVTTDEADGKAAADTEKSAKAPSPVPSEQAADAASNKAPEPMTTNAPESKEQKTPASNAAAVTTPVPVADPDAPPPLLEARKRELCKRYEGGFVTYYGNVYKVHQCKRYELTTDEIYDHTKRSGKLSEVDNDTIRALAYGGTYHNDYLATDKVSPCKKYNRQYITYAVDVYWVERCIKRLFPDWASYESHRGKLGSGNSQLHFVSWQEFASFKEGRPMPSVIDEEFRELSDTVDILPIDEACRGVVGQYVTYFDHIYFVESAQRPGAKKDAKSGVLACRKRIVDGEDYTRRHGHRRFHLKELSSSQAVSIPDGAPVKPKDDKKKPQDHDKKKARS